LTQIDKSALDKDLLERELGRNPHLLQSGSDENRLFIFGIIDYFQLYDCKKSMEKFFKKLMTCNPSLDTSSQPPKYYADRFIRWVNLILKSH
jgi:Phosphatidylinositol-4-phosphate 5-Kinase